MNDSQRSTDNWADDQTVFKSVPSAEDELTTLPGSLPNAATNDDQATTLPGAGRPVSVVRLEPGDLILGGKYRVVEPVNGGMEAEAYRGESTADGRVVFIKHQKRASSEARPELLEKLTACNHRGVIRLLDFELAERVLEVYEWIDGRALESVLKGGPNFTDDKIEDAIKQIAEGVRYLQETIGVAHRDIKPGNILVETGTPTRYIIADFGIMTLSDSGGYTDVAGTRKYFAPEGRMRKLERKDFLSYDWWCVGRVLQELADGSHPYDRIREMFPNKSIDEDALKAEWDKILFEDDPDTYGRAGQVEHSNSTRWKPLMRGLLTSDRQKRWGYSELTRVLRGESVQDGYDTKTTRLTFDLGPGSSTAAEVLRLSQEEHWDEAVRAVFENQGVYYFAKTQLGSKRVTARLERVDKVHEFLTGKNFSTATVEDLVTMVSLKAIGGDDVPLSLAGFELSETTLLRHAKRDKDSTSSLLAALTWDEVIDPIAAMDPEAAAMLQGFWARWKPVRDQIKAWNGNDVAMRSHSYMALCAFQTRAENEAIIEKAHLTLAHTETEEINRVFHSVERSDTEAASLAFILPSASGWQFVAHDTLRKRAVEQSYHRAQSLKQLYAWTAFRQQWRWFRLLGLPRTSWFLAMLASCTFTLGREPYLFSYLISIAVCSALAGMVGAAKTKSKRTGTILGSIIMILCSWIVLTNGEKIFFVLIQIIMLVATFLVIRQLRKTNLEQLHTYVTEQTAGGWFNDEITVAEIDALIAKDYSNHPKTLKAIEIELTDANAKIATAPADWGWQPQTACQPVEAIATFRTIVFIAGGVAVASYAVGLLLAIFGIAAHLVSSMLNSLIKH